MFNPWDVSITAPRHWRTFLSLFKKVSLHCMRLQISWHKNNCILKPLVWLLHGMHSGIRLSPQVVGLDKRETIKELNFETIV